MSTEPSPLEAVVPLIFILIVLPGMILNAGKFGLARDKRGLRIRRVSYKNDDARRVETRIKPPQSSRQSENEILNPHFTASYEPYGRPPPSRPPLTQAAGVPRAIKTNSTETTFPATEPEDDTCSIPREAGHSPYTEASQFPNAVWEMSEGDRVEKPAETRPKPASGPCVGTDGNTERLEANLPSVLRAGPGGDSGPMVFLCYSSKDKDRIRELYRRLMKDRVPCWFDEESLLPGQDWEYEIAKAMRSSKYVLVCLSVRSVSRTGYLQKELRQALDIADNQPEGSIYIIPVRLDGCEVPERLKRWHWVSLFEDQGYERLVSVLRSSESGGRARNI